MKLSARNQLKGKIVEVKKGATTPCPHRHRRQIVTASITNESADDSSSRPDRLRHVKTAAMVGVD